MLFNKSYLTIKNKPQAYYSPFQNWFLPKRGLVRENFIFPFYLISAKAIANAPCPLRILSQSVRTQPSIDIRVRFKECPGSIDDAMGVPFSGVAPVSWNRHAQHPLYCYFTPVKTASCSIIQSYCQAPLRCLWCLPGGCCKITPNIGVGLLGLPACLVLGSYECCIVIAMERVNDSPAAGCQVITRQQPPRASSFGELRGWTIRGISLRIFDVGLKPDRPFSWIFIHLLNDKLFKHVAIIIYASN